jgi:hypothetical protein
MNPQQLAAQLKMLTQANRFAFLQKSNRDKIIKSTNKPA